MRRVDVDETVPLAAWTRPLVNFCDASVDFVVRDRSCDLEKRAFLLTLLITKASIAIASAAEEDGRVTIGTFGHGWRGLG